MLYEYECDKCGTRFDLDWPMGKAPKAADCDKCGKEAKRAFSALAVGVDGRIDRTSGFGEQMKARNAAAARRMRGNRPGVRRIASDYGNGDIREA